jgi:hypothetical protein
LCFPQCVDEEFLLLALLDRLAVADQRVRNFAECRLVRG